MYPVTNVEAVCKCMLNERDTNGNIICPVHGFQGTKWNFGCNFYDYCKKEVKNIKSEQMQPLVYILTIKPALEPAERHKIEKVLEKLKYNITGSGSHINMSQCDISFERRLKK